MKRNIFALSFLILLSIAFRFVPHGYNFSPIGGMALLSGAYFTKKHLAFIVPIVLLFASDFLLNNLFYSSFFPEAASKTVFFSDFMLFTYGSIILMILFGMNFLKKITGPRLIGGALFSSIVFFLITNFGVWAGSLTYPQSLAGLGACYIAGLPFLTGNLIGNLVFTFILFGAYELLVNKSLVKVVSY